MNICMYAGYHVSSVQWPGSVMEASQAGLLTQQPEGGVQLEAEGSSARLVLHPHRRRLAVCYPLLVKHQAEQGLFEYKWQTQLFSCNEVPQRWLPAFRLVSAACQAFDRVDKARQTQADGKSERHAYPEKGPGPAQHEDSVQPTLSVTSRASALPSAIPEAAGVMQRYAADSWWLNDSSALLPPDDVVHFEWTPEATYQYVESLQVISVSSCSLCSRRCL